MCYTVRHWLAKRRVTRWLRTVVSQYDDVVGPAATDPHVCHNGETNVATDEHIDTAILVRAAWLWFTEYGSDEHFEAAGRTAAVLGQPWPALNVLEDGHDDQYRGWRSRNQSRAGS